jgi:hypothetical protein
VYFVFIKYEFKDSNDGGVSFKSWKTSKKVRLCDKYYTKMIYKTNFDIIIVMKLIIIDLSYVPMYLFYAPTIIKSFN